MIFQNNYFDVSEKKLTVKKKKNGRNFRLIKQRPRKIINQWS